jgi:hypothetical protein
MRALGAVLRHEWRLQGRSLRLRLGLGLYLAASVAPAVALSLVARRTGAPAHGAAHLELAAWGAPFLAVVWSVIVAGGTARVPGESQILLSAPMRNAAWVLRKWLAQLSIVVAGALLAFAAALAAAVALGASAVPWRNAALVWSVEVAPLAVLASAGYFGLVRILRSEVLALIAGAAVVPAAAALANASLASPLLVAFGVRLDVSRWSGLGGLVLQGWLLDALAGGDVRWDWWRASDADWDAAVALERALPRLALPAALALACLAVAVAHVGRSRPEHAPLAVAGDHPLRSLLAGWGRLRRRLRSDAGLDRVDRAVRAGGLVLAAAILAALVAHTLRWQAVARERHRVEVDEVGETTSRDVVPESFRVSGSLAPDGRVELEVEGTLRNGGSAARSHLAFHLDRHLVLDGLVVADPVTGARLAATTRRGWDRVEIDLEPALLPGASAVLAYALSGRPGADWLGLRRLGQESFASSWERHRDATLLADRSPLGRSWRVRAATPGRVRLSASDLLLAPRWDPWTLTPDQGPGQGGREMPGDEHTPSFLLSLDLELPPGWLLVDGCGAISQPAGRQVRHRSTCEVTLPEVALLGGRRELVVSPDGAARLAALPGHGPLAEEVLAAMGRTVELSAQAWPGLAGLGSIAAVEMPAEPWSGARRPWEEPAVLGRLIAVPEPLLRTQEPIAAPELVASLLTQQIEVARPVLRREERSVDALLRAVLLRRMGMGASSGWMWPPPHLQWRLGFPLLRAPAYDAMAWQVKVPALLRSIEAQLGAEAMMEGVREFVTTEDEESVGVRDLLAAVARAAGGGGLPAGAVTWLERLYDDFFVRGSIPELRVRDVAARREGPMWQVTASLESFGTGQVRCPVVVRSEAEELEQWVTVDSKRTVEVSFALATRPHTLVLDPERECFLLRDPARAANQHDLRGQDS